MSSFVTPTAPAGVTQSTTLTSPRVTLSAGSNSVTDSANLQFSGSTLTVGNAGNGTITGGAKLILNTTSNGDIELTPNGTGIVNATANGLRSPVGASSTNVGLQVGAANYGFFSTGGQLLCSANNSTIWRADNTGSIKFDAMPVPTFDVGLTLGSSSNRWNGMYNAGDIQGGSSGTPPSTQNISAVNGTGTNIAGSGLTFRTGLSTGNATPPSLKFQTGIIGSSGTTAQTAVDRQIIVGKSTTLTDAATSLFEIALPTLAMSGGSMKYTIRASDGTDMQVRSGQLNWSAVNKAGTYTTQVTIIGESIAASSGTLTATFAFLNGANKVTMQVTPTGSLAETTYDITYTLWNNSPQAITLL